MTQYKDMGITDFLNLASESSDEMASLGKGSMVDYETGQHFQVRDEETAIFVASARNMVEELCKRLNKQNERLQTIHSIAYDALHSMHYGEVEKPELQNLLKDIRDYSKKEETQ